MITDTGLRAESAGHPGPLVIPLVEFYELAEEAGSFEVIANIADGF
jgi:hypothetical protein